MVNGAYIGLQNPVAWQLRIRDHTLDDASLETRCSLENGGQYVTQSSCSLGRLDKFSLELLCEILLGLDVPTLVSLRRVNRLAMHLVNSLPQYSKIMMECPNVLRAIVSTRANGFDLRTLYTTLCTSSCANCGLFGGYLYLITCSRVCYFCFSSAPPYLPMTGFAARRSGVAKEHLDSIPHLLSLPGRYTSFEKLSKKRIKLFDRLAVRSKAWTGAESLPPDLKTREVKRYVAIISAPCFSTGQSVDWGVYCIGCRGSTESTSHFRLKYSQAGIFDHINELGMIRDVNGIKQHVRFP
jgi:hypothetical protein